MKILSKVLNQHEETQITNKAFNAIKINVFVANYEKALVMQDYTLINEYDEFAKVNLLTCKVDDVTGYYNFNRGVKSFIMN